MTDPAQIARLAEGLTAKQKAALRGAPSTPAGNVWLVCAGSTKLALVKRGLATGYGDWCTLTPLGLAVRAHLTAAQEKKDG